jgi:hypothetical protein
VASNRSFLATIVTLGLMLHRLFLVDICVTKFLLIILCMIYLIVTWYKYISYFLQSCPLGCSNCVEIDMLFNFLGPNAQLFMNSRVQVWYSLPTTSYPEHVAISTR